MSQPWTCWVSDTTETVFGRWARSAATVHSILEKVSTCRAQQMSSAEINLELHVNVLITIINCYQPLDKSTSAYVLRFCGVSAMQSMWVRTSQRSIITSLLPCHGCLHRYTHSVLFIYFASAAVVVDSSHMTASSSASWSRFSPPSNFVNGHRSTMWFVVCRWPHHRKVIRRDSMCASQHDMGLDLSGNGSSETMYEEKDRNPAV